MVPASLNNVRGTQERGFRKINDLSSAGRQRRAFRNKRPDFNEPVILFGRTTATPSFSQKTGFDEIPDPYVC
jgi:hypothetical protein